MRRNGKDHKAWTRKKANPARLTPLEIFNELNRREMLGLDTCRKVWEAELDPLAVCSALVQCPEVPGWLISALLVLVTEGETPYPPQKRKAWKKRGIKSRDACRAANVAAMRAHPEATQKWEGSFLLGEWSMREQFTDEPHVTPAAMKRSYQRVSAGLSNPTSYFHGAAGVNARILKAWEEFLSAMERIVAQRALSGK